MVELRLTCVNTYLSYGVIRVVYREKFYEFRRNLMLLRKGKPHKIMASYVFIIHDSLLPEWKEHYYEHLVTSESAAIFSIEQKSELNQAILELQYYINSRTNIC